MSRTKKTIINLALVLLFAVYIFVFFLPQNNYFYSLEEMFELKMRGSLYGPGGSIIMTHESPDGHSFVAGKYEDEFIMMEAARKGIWWTPERMQFWDDANGMAVEGAAFFMPGAKIVFGYSRVPETVEVEYLFQYISPGKNAAVLTDTAEVNEEGFFFCDYYERYKDVKTDIDWCTYIEGRNADGEVIWSCGGF